MYIHMNVYKHAYTNSYDKYTYAYIYMCRYV